MARVPYEAYPTAPVGGPEGDQFHIQASPADFGGLIGQGEEKLGAGLAQTGQNLASAGIAKQEFFNQVGADQAFNNLQSSYYKMTYGDPSTGKTGIYGLRGEDAVRASQTIGDQMDQVREGIKNSLPNEAMKLQFDQASRRLQMFTMDAIGRHVDNQSSVYALNVNKSAIANQGLAIAVNPEDETNYQNSLHELTRAYVRSAQVTNGMNASDDIINNATHEAEQDAIKQRVLSWANKNPSAADAWLQSQKTKLDPIAFDAIQTHIRGLSDKASVAATIQSIGAPSGATPSSATVDNNVGNIRASNVSWDGKGAPVGGFETFATPELGVKAAVQNLQSYADHNGGSITLQQAISRWAPSGDGNNDPLAYTMAVSRATGLRPIDALPLNDANAMAGVVKAMTQVEKGKVPFSDEVFQSGAAAAINGTPLGGGQHNPAPYGMEAAIMSEARRVAQEKYPDRPDLQRQVIDGKWQEIQQNNALQLKYEAEQAKQKRDGEEAAGQQVVKSLMTPGSNYDDLVKNIRDNPSLTADQKLHLWSIAQTHYAGDAAHDVKTYGPGFWNLYQQVHAEQGNPNRITDVSQLWQHGGPNGDLTLAGIEKLTGEIQGRRTPEGEAEGKMKTGALAYAKHELSFEADLGMTKIRDPKGEGIFNVGFLPAFYKAYDAGIAAGKTPYQLLSKDSPDFIVDKLVGAYKRTPVQISQDMLSENSGEAPSTEQPAQPAQQQQPDLNTQAGIIAAYNSGKLTRDQAASALVSKGFARAATAPASATPVGPQVPR